MMPEKCRCEDDKRNRFIVLAEGKYFLGDELGLIVNCFWIYIKGKLTLEPPNITNGLR
jgi:hypothetical protein